MSPRVQNVFIQPQRQRQRQRRVSRPHTHTHTYTVGAQQHGHVEASMGNALDFNKQPERPPACQLTWPLAASLLAWFQFVLITQKINKKGGSENHKESKETKQREKQMHTVYFRSLVNWVFSFFYPTLNSLVKRCMKFVCLQTPNSSENSSWHC